MPSPVCAVGSKFQGHCSACDGSWVEGEIVEGEFVTIDGKNICVTGSLGRGYCGHETRAVGQSAVWRVNGKQVARVGDPVQGTITGTLTQGTWVNSD